MQTLLPDLIHMNIIYSFTGTYFMRPKVYHFLTWAYLALEMFTAKRFNGDAPMRNGDSLGTLDAGDFNVTVFGQTK